MLNRCSGRRRVGLASSSMRARAFEHRRALAHPNTADPAIRADLIAHGAAAFVFLTLEVHSVTPEAPVAHRSLLRQRELWWALNLNCLDERTGYNREAGGMRSPASRFRDMETKLMRANSRRYVGLPWVDRQAPINIRLLRSWLAADATIHRDKTMMCEAAMSSSLDDKRD